MNQLSLLSENVSNLQSANEDLKGHQKALLDDIGNMRSYLELLVNAKMVHISQVSIYLIFFYFLFMGFLTFLEPSATRRRNGTIRNDTRKRPSASNLNLIPREK